MGRFFQAKHSITIVDVEMESLAVFVYRQSELILPFLGIKRPAGCGALLFALWRDGDAALVGFIGFEIKDKQVLVLTLDQLSNEFIPAFRIPFHELQNLGIEYPAGDGLRLIGGGLPNKGVLDIIGGGSDHHHLRVGIDQHHYEVHIRDLAKTGRIERQLEIADGNARLVAVVEVFTAYHLEAVVVEVVVMPL